LLERTGLMKKLSERGNDMMHMMLGSQVSATNMTDTSHHSKSQVSPSSKAEMRKDEDEDAGDMIRSLLERTGLMKKLSERGNAGPCVFEISRHCDVKRFLFNVDVIFCC